MQRTSGGRSMGRRTRMQPQFGNERRDLSAAGPGRALQGRRGVEQGTEGEGRKRGASNSGRERDRTASEASRTCARSAVRMPKRLAISASGVQSAAQIWGKPAQGRGAEPEGDQSERERSRSSRAQTHVNKSAPGRQAVDQGRAGQQLLYLRGDRQVTAGADPALAARAGTQVGVQTQSAAAVQGPGTEGGGPAPGDGRAITASARRDSIRIQGARAEGPSRGSPSPVMCPRSRVRLRCVLRGRDCAGCAA